MDNLKQQIKAAIELLEDNGYIVSKKEDSPNIENYSFSIFWTLYDKKCGPKSQIERKWNKLSNKEKKDILEYIPKYKKAQPFKQYRKNPLTFLNQRGWEDELIEYHGNRNSKLGAMQTIIDQRSLNAAEPPAMEREVFNPFKVSNGI